MKWIMVLLLLVVVGVCAVAYKDIAIQYADDYGISQMLGIDLSALGFGAQPAQNNATPNVPNAQNVQGEVVVEQQMQYNRKTSCESGNVNDCLLYAAEQLEKQKPLDAIKVLIKPCEMQHNQSCAIIANIYDDMSKKYNDKSVNYYKTACDNGGLDGCYGLGVKYFRGESVKQNFKESFSLFKKVCDGGKVEGCNNLAVMYNNANGIKRDTKLAREMFKKACDSGYKPSCDNLAKMKG